MDAATDFATRLDRHLAQRPTYQVGVRAPHLGIEYRHGSDLPFHAASAGKLITTALVAQLVDAGTVTWDTPVADVLGADELAGLFLPGDPATLDHLLSHTSGVNDYFDGRVTSGVPVARDAVAHPERTWTPADLLAVTRERQRPIGRPGERFHYSDTGFVLLGRVLEEVTGTAFATLAHERVFAPLGLASAFLPHRTTPAVGADATTIVPLHLGRTDVSRAASLTCDWAGGGTAATTADWLTLSAALHDGRLLSPDALAHLSRPRNRFRTGLDYGAGTMTVRFEGFMPWLRGWPRLVGHLGVTSAHVWHDPDHGAEIVVNAGSARAMSSSFRTLFEVVRLLGRARVAAPAGVRPVGFAGNRRLEFAGERPRAPEERPCAAPCPS